jgi:hypothetical protein
VMTVVTTKHSYTSPLSAQLQKDFLAALPETMPSTSFTNFSFILSRIGKPEFCDHMFRCIIHSLHGGMASRHALRHVLCTRTRTCAYCSGLSAAGFLHVAHAELRR